MGQNEMGGQQSEEWHGCLLQTTKMERKQMKSDSQLIKLFDCQTCLSLGIFTTPVSAGRVTRKG